MDNTRVEDDQREFEGDMSLKMYRELLVGSYEKIANLRLALGTAQNQEVNLRDEIAKTVFPTFLLQTDSGEDAAKQSYSAADKLIRVKETGSCYDSDIILLLKEMRDSSKNDDVFGRVVRNFLRNQ